MLCAPAREGKISSHLLENLGSHPELRLVKDFTPEPVEGWLVKSAQLSELTGLPLMNVKPAVKPF